MAPKQVLDKLAWQWAEQTNPSQVTFENIRTAFRVTLRCCPVNVGVCRKNCMGNPNCLNGLGEKAWMEKNLDEELKDAIVEMSKEANRSPDSFIGLKNLGATCYANTFLQVWFHNPEFRRGILQWTDDTKNSLNSSSSSDRRSAEKKSFLITMEQLQFVFAQLSFSVRPFIDPSSFIKCLQLDTTLQQDAQEFSKLFISLLEDQLPAKECYDGLNLIQHQFVGHYEYVTSCNGCRQQSRSRSKFYEIDLNIKGHTNLAGCLQEFLQEERLDGDNQYYCQFCMRKQDAVRKIHLLDLPPTLNLQLLRFVFDRHTLNKKKLMSYLQFPETLDMNAYMGNSGTSAGGNGELIYDLVSVLIHHGPGAHSGHYVAAVKDLASKATYRFNDEEVEKVPDKEFLLETEDNDGNKGGQKRPRPAKGFLCSRNAYMLVYRRRNRNGSEGMDSVQMTLDMLPEHVRQQLELDNEKHEEYLRDQLETKMFYIEKERERQTMVKTFFGLLQGSRDKERNDEFEWVSMNWLKEWLASDSMGTVPPVDNMPLLCPHDRVDPDSVCQAKLLPTAAANILFEKFGGCLRLPCLDSMCRQCVEERCRVIHMKATITEENRLITAFLKSKDIIPDYNTSFWVGKRSIKLWRRMAEVTLCLSVTPQKENGEHDDVDDGSGKDSASDVSKGIDGISFSAPDTTDAVQATGSDDRDFDESEKLSFNEDLLCAAHDNLSSDHACRRLVSSFIWDILKKYFPKAPEFHFNSPVCQFCQTQHEQEKLYKEQDKANAADQRMKLVELYLDKKRPVLSADMTHLNIISCRFLEEWRRFIKDPMKQTVAPSTDNMSFLCNHGGFMYNLESCELLNERYTYIWPQEWQILTTHFKGDVEISVKKYYDEIDGYKIVTSPEFCQRCCLERRQTEYTSQFVYAEQSIFVRKVTDETQRFFERTLKSKCPVSGNAVITIPDGDRVLEEPDDMDIVTENGKRKHANNSAGEKVPRVDGSSMAAVRRSTRRGTVQNEMKLSVSSKLTLKEVKIMLVKSFSVLKMDQHLFLDGVELCDDDATLEKLQVPPGAILYLKADEPTVDNTMDVSPVNLVEEGFKGTTLVGR